MQSSAHRQGKPKNSLFPQYARDSVEGLAKAEMEEAMQAYITEAGKKTIRDSRKRIVERRPFYQARIIVGPTACIPAQTEKRFYWSREAAAQAVRTAYPGVEVLDQFLWY